MSNSKNHSLKFEKALESNDYGLIIGEEGELKGIWVPDHLYDEPVPEALAQLCMMNYGINPNGQNPMVVSTNLH